MQYKARAAHLERIDHEFVALIAGNYWFELDNEAHAGLSFDVSDETVRSLLTYMDEHRIAPETLTLWHSHPRSYGPSQYDLEHFPGWVSIGQVFHAPTGVTTVYTAEGLWVQPSMTNSDKTSTSEALATLGDADG